MGPLGLMAPLGLLDPLVRSAALRLKAPSGAPCGAPTWRRFLGDQSGEILLVCRGRRLREGVGGRAARLPARLRVAVGQLAERRRAGRRPFVRALLRDVLLLRRRRLALRLGRRGARVRVLLLRLLLLLLLLLRWRLRFLLLSRFGGCEARDGVRGAGSGRRRLRSPPAPGPAPGPAPALHRQQRGYVQHGGHRAELPLRGPALLFVV